MSSFSNILFNPKFRAGFYQAALAVLLILVGYSAVTNALQNLKVANISTGFGFLQQVSGFDVSQHLIAYDGGSSTYARAFVVGLLNTLLVSAIAMVIATVLGVAIGTARLSSNPLMSFLARWYVEIMRNTPLLLQLVFWYNAVLQPLPDPKNSLKFRSLTPDASTATMFGGLVVAIALILIGNAIIRRISDQPPVTLLRRIAVVALCGACIWFFLHSGSVHRGEEGVVFLNNRGLIFPRPNAGDGFAIWLMAIILAVLGAIILHVWNSRRRKASGQSIAAIRIGLILIAATTLIGAVLLVLNARPPLSWDFPRQTRFNLVGGAQILPEFAALLCGLSLYTAAYIAEIYRAGIASVKKGQWEATYALGLNPLPSLRLVIFPQAMRVMIPLLTNQYVNLIKNSTLAVAVGYPDLVQIFAGTVLNQTGQAVEVVLMTMAVYLFISLVTSLFMNLYNRRVLNRGGVRNA